MISGPMVDGFYFWRRRSLIKREIITENDSIIVGLGSSNYVVIIFSFLRKCLIYVNSIHSRVDFLFFIFIFYHTFTFQLLDKPWSQVSSLLPPGSCLQFYRA